ncbi:MAG: UbiA family prenyltransferase [Chitinophagales bacterium]
MLRKIFDFFIFSSLYISLCAVVMVWQTYYLVLHSMPPFHFFAFVFFATMCSYNFHWWLTPESAGFSDRIQWAAGHKGWHLWLCFLGLAGTAISFLYIREHWIALAFGAFITFLYSAPKLPQPIFRSLKKIAIGKTLFLSFVWTYVTSVLPVFIDNKLLQGESLLFAVGRFGLIYAICILFDYRDREDDKRDGIRSMITYFGEKGIDLIFSISLSIFVISTLILYYYNYPIQMLLIILFPGLLVAGLYRYAKRNFSDYLYYFVLDGLMMLSGLLIMILRI